MVAVLFLLDRLLLWVESRGWIYYRRIKPNISSSGSNILLGLNAVFQPHAHHMIEAKEEAKLKKVQPCGDADPPQADSDQK